jgi:glycosyl transferase family 1
MNDRIRTLLLEANGTHWAAVAIDTVGQGLLTHRSSKTINRSPLLRKLFGNRYGDASYMTDWRDAFSASEALAVDRCNVTNLVEFRASKPRIHDYDFVVVLHSAAGDRMGLLNRTAQWFQGRRGKLAVFIGNEYDLMEEKIAFVRSSGADYVCSQLPLEIARSLYAGSGAAVLAMPHALNPEVYRVDPSAPRTIDVAFVGDLYDRLIGDRERTRIVQFFAEHGQERGLRCDIRAARMPRDEWARYLNTCHGVVGAESGTYYLQRTGDALNCAKSYLKEHPAASFEAVHERCFAGPGPFLNGKAISSRHFEPIGTRTCQLLVEGRYNGILEADRHYIAVRRDLSNIDEAIARFKDPACRAAVTDHAYEHVLSGHTYAHRVRALVESAFGSSRGGRAA